MLANLEEPRINPEPKRRIRKRSLSRRQRSNASVIVDKATIAAALELEELQREFIYSCISLGMKMGLLAIFAVSFVKLGVASHDRILRQLEMVSILRFESRKLNQLNSRFDKLFAIGGENRLISEQEHLITPNSVRVVWK
ncbi:hypothetical protein [Prochlorococcus sp. MIT 1223]|uniref:hypothetical protein n=1 Tax=Prochlorococcus sp. MIT 1223 TaxID=3096217 RepID=UPI002A753CE3|nr:hypothetical protein [Prochlorococcus sp. MIT 1223]